MVPTQGQTTPAVGGVWQRVGLGRGPDHGHGQVVGHPGQDVARCAAQVEDRGVAFRPVLPVVVPSDDRRHACLSLDADQGSGQRGAGHAVRRRTDGDHAAKVDPGCVQPRCRPGGQQADEPAPGTDRLDLGRAGGHHDLGRSQVDHRTVAPDDDRRPGVDGHHLVSLLAIEDEDPVPGALGLRGRGASRLATADDRDIGLVMPDRDLQLARLVVPPRRAAPRRGVERPCRHGPASGRCGRRRCRRSRPRSCRSHRPGTGFHPEPGAGLPAPRPPRPCRPARRPGRRRRAGTDRPPRSRGGG